MEPTAYTLTINSREGLINHFVALGHNKPHAQNQYGEKGFSNGSIAVLKMYIAAFINTSLFFFIFKSQYKFQKA